jgi:hypothetical protein
MLKLFLFFLLTVAPVYALTAQSHVSVTVEDHIYQILDLAVGRGLCRPLPASKPYTRAVILSAINEALGAESAGRGRLNAAERLILENEREKYTEKKEGLDPAHGRYFAAGTLFKKNIKISAEAGLKMDAEFSQAVKAEPETAYSWGETLWISAYLKGDIGNHFSYDATISGGILRAGRKQNGVYHTYYEGFDDHGEFIDRELPVHSEPLAYFPFTYKKMWDSSVFFFDELNSSGYQTFPERLAGAYAINGDVAASFLDGTLSFRFGRLRREWAAMSPGSSLIFNGNAQPFLAIEGQFQPLSWFSISSLTGELEYFNQDGIKISSWSSQNAFSITMLEFNIKNFLHIDFGDAVVWPKRFELGYPFPLLSSFFYQNNIGDFDNLAMFLDIKGSIPGIASAWVSFFCDEMELQPAMGILDRTMLAFQAGTTVHILPLPFSFIKLSYTKIEPYCYTHNRNFVPWYNDLDGGRPMETAYMNNGVGIGYYLPPNSDELLLRFETMAGRATNIHFQYQMIRHGADFGPNAVDGSAYFSELDPDGRDEKDVLKKYFLHDGAYQWFHILKAGAEHRLDKLSAKVYGEAGVVFSYFTNIDGPANQGEPAPYRIVDEAPYSKSTAVILTLGVKLFPDL